METRWRSKLLRLAQTSDERAAAWRARPWISSEWSWSSGKQKRGHFLGTCSYTAYEQSYAYMQYLHTIIFSVQVPVHTFYHSIFKYILPLEPSLLSIMRSFKSLQITWASGSIGSSSSRRHGCWAGLQSCKPTSFLCKTLQTNLETHQHM